MSKKTITRLFRFARHQGAQALTIENQSDRLSLDYHFPGGERQTFSLPKKLEKELMADLRQLLKVAPGELAVRKYCKITDKNHSDTFHISILPGEFGEKIMISQTAKEARVWRLKQLGATPLIRKSLQASLKMKSGLILIGGPALSGKSATFQALLRELNRNDKSVYLLGEEAGEDLDGLNVLPLTAVNWDRIMHHDSEIIAVSDLDDPSDLRHALIAAGTGRLVLGVISADSVWEILQNILSQPLPLKLKLDSLKIISNQRLVKMQRTKGKGRRGRRGEIALFELLKLTPRLKNLILENEALFASGSAKKAKLNKLWTEVSNLAQEEGFQPWTLDKQDKIRTGILAADNQ